MSDDTAQVIDAPAEVRQDIVSVPAVMPPEPATLAVAPQVRPKDLVDRLEAIKETTETAMVEGVDYGVIPGTQKPTLLKPGAEKLGVLFQLDVQLRNEQRFETGGHLTVTSRATVFHAPTGARLGYGEGVCTTRERKYAYRRQERTCPDCNQPTVLESRKENEPGFFCWRKKGGCGNTFAADDDRLTRQEIGEVENPDLPDLWNTVTKMAEKRARVDAVLAVTGASAKFTQDVEDTPAAAAVDGTSASTDDQLPSWATMLNKERAPEVLKELERLLGHDQARGILVAVHKQIGGLPAVLLPFTKAIADVASNVVVEPAAAAADSSDGEGADVPEEPAAATEPAHDETTVAGTPGDSSSDAGAAAGGGEPSDGGIFEPPASPIFGGDNQ